MARLTANVWVGGAWYGPAYPDAGNPPKGSVTNPGVWDGPVPDAGAETPTVSTEAAQAMAPGGVDADEQDGPPPKSGTGSSDEAWTAYARRQGVQVTDDMRRKDVIAACKAAGVPTE